MIGNDYMTTQGGGGEPNAYLGIESYDWEIMRGDGVGNQIPIVRLHRMM